MKSLLIVLSLFIGTLVAAQQTTSGSPYFATSSQTDAANFSLQSTTADVIIGGPIADVTVNQVYHNAGNTPIEAQYVFPASTRAAVYAMEMKIGDRTLKAKIKEKQAARATYEAAKKEGKRTSLLEQHRPNVFQMNVANIMPGEKVIVTLKYTEFIIPENQVYAFVYPAVVGPRYTGNKPEAFTASPHTQAGGQAPYHFDVRVSIQAPVPFQKIFSNTHLITQENKSSTNALVKFDIAETNPGNRDYVLNYQLAGNEIMTGVTTYDNGDEKFFLCQIEPPSRSTKLDVSPREYIFVIDVSGSMRGYPLDISKYLMKNLLSKLRPTDKFNVLFFAGSAFTLSPQSIDATPENIKSAFHQLDQQEGGGSTELLPALQQAMAIPKARGYSRSFVISTDGYVNVEPEAFRYISKNLKKANFFAFGIGSSVNRHLIEGIAHVGRAEAFIVKNQEEAKSQALKLKKYIEHPVLTDIEISGQSVKLIDVVPESTPDLMAERPIYFFGKYDNRYDATLTITGQQGNKSFKKVVALPNPSNDNRQLAYLWAREKIRYLGDFGTYRNQDKNKKEITDLGLKYNLLTKYTSFVAVDDRVVNDNLGLKTGRQVLPMPQGVPNTAIGFEMELDETISGSTKQLSVDVKAESSTVEGLVDAILEDIFKNTLTASEIRALMGTSLTVVYQENKFVSTKQELSRNEKYLIELVNKRLQRLGFPIERGHIISIGISS